jgi:multiple sugar transport system substrate-binding protein
VCVAAVAAGCGGSSSKSSSSGSEGTPIKGGSAVTPAMASSPSGNVTWCIGKDTTGAFSQVVSQYNQSHPQVHVKLLELPTSADQQRTQLVQRERAKSSECDVLGMDVIWTAEYAAQGWLKDVSDYISQNGDKFIKSTVDTTNYQGKNWAVPFNSNAGFIFYRTDQVQSAPKDWESLYKDAADNNGIVYQGFRYEGLTVDFLELLYSKGGSIVSDDGKKATANSQEVKDVLKFMADGIKNGAAPKAVTTYKEEEARRAFESGNATFMRNWPYAYALDKKSKIGSKFDIATFPGFSGQSGAGVLGGYNLGISAFSKNPSGSLAFIEFATKPDQQQIMATEASLPPVTSATYDSAAVKKAMPFAAELKTAIEQAKPRPVSPVYPQISEAVYNNVYDALQGKASPDEAASKMNDEIQKALETF